MYEKISALIRGLQYEFRIPTYNTRLAKMKFRLTAWNTSQLLPGEVDFIRRNFPGVIAQELLFRENSPGAKARGILSCGEFDGGGICSGVIILGIIIQVYFSVWGQKSWE